MSKLKSAQTPGWQPLEKRFLHLQHKQKGQFAKLQQIEGLVQVEIPVPLSSRGLWFREFLDFVASNRGLCQVWFEGFSGKGNSDRSTSLRIGSKAPKTASGSLYVSKMFCIASGIALVIWCDCWLSTEIFAFLLLLELPLKSSCNTSWSPSTDHICLISFLR